jgi:hypothetical protein
LNVAEVILQAVSTDGIGPLLSNAVQAGADAIEGPADSSHSVPRLAGDWGGPSVLGGMGWKWLWLNHKRHRDRRQTLW